MIGKVEKNKKRKGKTRQRKECMSEMRTSQKAGKPTTFIQVDGGTDPRTPIDKIDPLYGRLVMGCRTVAVRGGKATRGETAHCSICREYKSQRE